MIVIYHLWQWVKHAWLHSDLFQALNGEHLTVPGFQQWEPEFLINMHGKRMITISTYIYIYMGSSSVLVLTGSHSLCKFCCKSVPFFHTKWRKFGCTQEAMRAMWWEKMFHLFFICKIYSHVTQKWWPKTGMRYPTARVGSYFIPD